MAPSPSRSCTTNSPSMRKLFSGGAAVISSTLGWVGTAGLPTSPAMTRVAPRADHSSTDCCGSGVSSLPKRVSAGGWPAPAPWIGVGRSGRLSINSQPWPAVGATGRSHDSPSYPSATRDALFDPSGSTCRDRQTFLDYPRFLRAIIARLERQGRGGLIIFNLVREIPLISERREVARPAIDWDRAAGPEAPDAGWPDTDSGSRSDHGPGSTGAGKAARSWCRRRECNDRASSRRRAGWGG